MMPIATLSPDAEAEIGRILATHADAEGPLLPILHDVMAAFGHVPEAAIPVIANALNLSRAEVHGVVSFYHDFHVEPEHRAVIRLCRAESCQARGVEALAAAFAGEDRVAIEPVYCLGLCTVGPNAMVAGVPHARLDSTKFAALIERAIAEHAA